MPRIDPHRFTGLQLVPTIIADDDYSVAIDGLRAGRIVRQPRAFGKEKWLWIITGPYLAAASLPSSGETETLEEARVEFRRVFDEWLRWAIAQGEPVHWHGWRLDSTNSISDRTIPLRMRSSGGRRQNRVR